LSVFFAPEVAGASVSGVSSLVFVDCIVGPAIYRFSSGFLLIKVLLSSLLSSTCVVLDCLVSALMHEVQCAISLVSLVHGFKTGNIKKKRI
jgi:hypothetical protein